MEDIILACLDLASEVSHDTRFTPKSNPPTPVSLRSEFGWKYFSRISPGYTVANSKYARYNLPPPPKKKKKKEQTYITLHFGCCFHHHLSLNREGRWGTTDDLITTFLLSPLFSTALWDLANSSPVHSLMLSSDLFLCLPYLLPLSTVPCKMVLARPDERET